MKLEWKFTLRNSEDKGDFSHVQYNKEELSMEDLQRYYLVFTLVTSVKKIQSALLEVILIMPVNVQHLYSN